MKNNYLLIFDLDGVLINSKQNMRFAWNETKQKYGIKKNFNSYFKCIGLPFNKILIKLKINKNKSLIAKTYQKHSIKNFDKINLYRNVFKVINKLKKEKNKLAIVTSKDFLRTKKILKKFNLNFDIVCSPKPNLRGKPYPDQLNYVIKKLKFDKNKNKVFYIGDMLVDYKASKLSKINFIFAKYGYGKTYRFYDKKINNIEKIFKYL